MVDPVVALTAASNLQQRIMLAKRFQIHTILACYQSGQTNISQNMLINESMVIAKRRKGERPPMRIISLDRFPTDENRAAGVAKVHFGVWRQFTIG